MCILHSFHDCNEAPSHSYHILYSIFDHYVPKVYYKKIPKAAIPSGLPNKLYKIFPISIIIALNEGKRRVTTFNLNIKGLGPLLGLELRMTPEISHLQYLLGLNVL